MSRLISTLAPIAVICTVCQCSPCRYCPAANTPAVWVEDSVRIEYRERIVHDTVDFVPPEFYERHETADTLSIIENDYARTAAVVHDGILSHDLQMKRTIIRVPVYIPVRDTTTYESHDERETVTEHIEVEKELTWWQSLKMRVGGWTMLALLILAIALGVSLWRNRGR